MAGPGVEAVPDGVRHDGSARLRHVVRALPAPGRAAKVCVDTGHHAPGTNIEFIVAFLLREQKARRVRLQLPALHGTRHDRRRRRPVQLFRILFEARVRGGFEPGAGIAFMLDQCQNTNATT